MSARFTKELRQQIVREFALRNGGVYDPAAFVEEVRANGPDHPAYQWFDWDDASAAHEHRLWQARKFQTGLRISFRIEDVGRGGAMRLRHVEMPLVLSPAAGRKDGGGYYLSDPENPEHMAEYCAQAKTALSEWLRRYEGAVVYSGGAGSLTAVRRVLASLESKAADEENKEAA